MVIIRNDSDFGRLLRDFGRIEFALLAILALTFTGLWATNANLQRDVQRGRETARIAREVMNDAALRQAALRGYLATGDGRYLAPDAAARRRVQLRLDSLALHVRDDDVQRGRAVALRNALTAWNAVFASVASGARPADPTLALRDDERLFGVVRAAHGAFLDGAESRYGGGQGMALLARRAMLAIVLAEFLLLGVALALMRRRVRGQAEELGEKQTALEEQAVQLEQQVEELSVLTEELDFTNTELEREIATRTQETVERQRLEGQLLQAQKMDSIGRLAGGVAHDFNNLLTVILSYAAFARQQVGDGDPAAQDIAAIEEAGRRAAVLTGQLLAFSRKQVMQPQLIDLDEVVESLDRMLRRVIGSDIEMVLRLGGPLPPIHADRGQLEQVLMNLIVNARDALRGGGRISVETAVRDIDDEHAGRRIGVRPGRYVLLAVSDTGVGMPPEVLQQVFEPFFTTKPAGEGTGLGLAMVYGIVKQSGGDLWVYSEQGVGTTFKLYFPVAEAEEAPRLAPAVTPHLATGHETVLVVEDDPTLRPLTTRILRNAGYEVLTASDGREALEIARNYEGTIDIVASDVVMPHVSGGALAAELIAARPGIRVLFLSGYTDDDLVRRGVVQHESAFLQKPFTPAELTARIREVLDGRPRG